MSSVHIVQPTAYNGTFSSSGSSGENSIGGTASKNNIIADQIDFRSEITLDSQSQGQSKWKIYKKPKLRRKKSIENDSLQKDENHNLDNGTNNRWVFYFDSL